MIRVDDPAMEPLRAGGGPGTRGPLPLPLPSEASDRLTSRSWIGLVLLITTAPLPVLPLLVHEVLAALPLAAPPAVPRCTFTADTASRAVMCFRYFTNANAAPATPPMHSSTTATAIHADAVLEDDAPLAFPAPAAASVGVGVDVGVPADRGDGELVTNMTGMTSPKLVSADTVTDSGCALGRYVP